MKKGVNWVTCLRKARIPSAELVANSGVVGSGGSKESLGLGFSPSIVWHYFPLRRRHSHKPLSRGVPSSPGFVILTADRRWLTHTLEYHATPNRSRVLMHATVWGNPEHAGLSKGNQTRNIVWAHLCEMSTPAKSMKTECRLEVASGWERDSWGVMLTG